MILDMEKHNFTTQPNTTETQLCSFLLKQDIEMYNLSVYYYFQTRHLQNFKRAAKIV